MGKLALFILLFVSSNSKVDLNRASLSELLSSLPIDSSKVVKLYEYRETFGYFENVYELEKLPFLNPDDIKVIKEKAIVGYLGMEEAFSFYAQEVRERAVTEESPQESALDYWLTALSSPLNVNKATIDELYSIYGVSLIDATQVVKRAKMLDFQRASHLRRTPGLSYYGYRNMLPYITFRDPKPSPFIGWVNISVNHYSQLFQEESSDIESRLEELTSAVSDTTTTLWTNLKEAGWTSEDSLWLANQLLAEKVEADRLKPKPNLRVKFNGLAWGKLRVGLSYYSDPYRSEFDPKYFASLEKINLPLDVVLNKAIAGYYRITLDQGLFLDNSDEGRSRLMDRVFGLYGDLSAYRAFVFYGGAVELSKGPVKLMAWHSYTPRDGVEDKDGNLIFYYSSNFVPSTFKNKFYEKVQGFNLKYDFPGKLIGTQIGVSGMRIQYSRPMACDFSFMDIPGDREDFSDPVFNWIGGSEKKFVQISARTVYYPFSLETEYSKEIGGGDAYIVKARIQQSIFNITFLYRDYDINYTNPYARPFYEDTRFRYTVLTRSYRLIDPLYANLANLPFPKPEQGFYVEGRYQPFARLLFPRVYLDVWKDKSDLQKNVRGQFQAEYRLINQFRIRYTYRYQNKSNPRYLGVSSTNLNENSIQFMIPYGGTFFTAEYRSSIMKLTERGIDFRTSINGSFLSFYIDRDVTSSLSIKAGAVVWATNGYSLWHFEDTGIDFLYGDGSKWFISVVERLSPRLGIRFKIKDKLTAYPHTGLLGRKVVDSQGNEVYLPFVDERRVVNLRLIVDYSF